MKRFCLCGLVTWSYLLLISCGGSLSEEERKTMREGMEQNTIKKVSDAELTQAAFLKGREIIKQLDTDNMESVARLHRVKINRIEPNSENAQDIENQLIEAYLTSSSASADNVQRIGTDSVLYTSPIVEKHADGVEEIKGMWSIYIPQKQLVLAMPKKKKKIF